MPVLVSETKRLGSTIRNRDDFGAHYRLNNALVRTCDDVEVLNYQVKMPTDRVVVCLENGV